MPTRRPEDVQRTHAIDTLGALARDLAHPVAAFYKGLLAEGIEPADARRFTRAFLRELVGQIRRGATEL
jgi:hypothetical protein